MNKLKEFLTRHEHIKGLFVSEDMGSWNTSESKGLNWKTREEILGKVGVAASTASNPKSNEESKTKKSKKK